MDQLIIATGGSVGRASFLLLPSPCAASFVALASGGWEGVSFLCFAHRVPPVGALQGFWPACLYDMPRPVVITLFFLYVTPPSTTLCCVSFAAMYFGFLACTYVTLYSTTLASWLFRSIFCSLQDVPHLSPLYHPCATRARVRPCQPRTSAVVIPSDCYTSYFSGANPPPPCKSRGLPPHAYDLLWIFQDNVSIARGFAALTSLRGPRGHPPLICPTPTPTATPTLFMLP